MLSGGADSVALLAKLLKETDAPIHAHHINYKNILGRDEAETNAAINCVQFCQQYYRDFEYSSSTIDLSFINNINFPDIMHTNYIAGQIVADDPNIAQYAKGAIADDYSGGCDIHDALARDELAKNMFYLLVPKEKSPLFTYPIKSMTKKDIMESMPLELAKLTWSCRMPTKKDKKYIHRCGECRTCIQILNCLPTLTGLTQEWFFETVELSEHVGDFGYVQ